jgi:FkbM family methyltransferase
VIIRHRTQARPNTDVDVLLTGQPDVPGQRQASDPVHGAAAAVVVDARRRDGSARLRIAKLISTLADLGPLQGLLAVAAKLSGRRSLERDVLRWLDLAFVRSRYGVKMKSNWDDATFNLCFSAAYGSVLRDLIRRQDRPFLFLDIGANQGVYSLIAGRNPCCRLALAFEPVPATFALLEANIAANRLGSRVRAINKAIAAKAGTTLVRMKSRHSGSATMAPTNTLAGEAIAIHAIRRQGLDELIPDGQEAILIKIDVEGLEPVVVAELVNSRHVDRMAWIFYEMDESWAEPKQVESMLRNVGFRSFHKVKAEAGATHYDVLAAR